MHGRQWLMESPPELPTNDQSDCIRAGWLFHALNDNGITELGIADRPRLIRQLHARKCRH